VGAPTLPDLFGMIGADRDDLDAARIELASERFPSP